MSKAARAPPASLSRMLDTASDASLSESDNDLTQTPASIIEESVPRKKKSGPSSSRATINPNKVTKAKPPARATSGGAKKPAPKKTNTNRKPLSEKTNIQNDSEIEEVEEFEESMEIDENERPPTVAAKNKKTKSIERNPEPEPVKKPRKKQVRQEENEEGEDNAVRKPGNKKQSNPQPRIPASSKSRSTTTKPAPSRERRNGIPETQSDSMDIDNTSGTVEGEQSVIEPLPSLPTVKPAPTYRARSESRQRRPERTRSASASDREGRATDPALRRKLGEATKKLKSLEIKYRNLQEIGPRTAESNFEKLKKASDERAKRKNRIPGVCDYEIY